MSYSFDWLMNDGGGMMECCGSLFGFLWMGAGLIVVAVLLFVLYALATGSFPQYSGHRARRPVHGPPSSAEGILDRRYARGEISREEYLDMVADMRYRR